MIRIEDKTSKKFGNLVEKALQPIFSLIPAQDLQGIDKISLLDECPDPKFKKTGGFYCLGHDGSSTHIELYPPRLVEGIPFFLPKISFFQKYSIVIMFLHELGHHKCGIKNLEKREVYADEYMIPYIKKLYGGWFYFFCLMGKIDYGIRKLVLIATKKG